MMGKSHHQRKKQTGLTLMLEVLLGLSLVTMVLLVIFQLFPVADRSVGLADRTTQANYLARSVLESEMERDYADLLPGKIRTESKVDNHTLRRGSELSTDFVYTVEISEPDELEIKNVLVSVTWKEGAADKDRPSSVRLESAKGRMW